MTPIDFANKEQLLPPSRIRDFYMPSGRSGNFSKPFGRSSDFRIPSGRNGRMSKSNLRDALDTNRRPRVYKRKPQDEWDSIKKPHSVTHAPNFAESEVITKPEESNENDFKIQKREVDSHLRNKLRTGIRDVGGSHEVGSDVADDVHIIFTTGCTPYEHWQSEVMFWSWNNVNHPGRITRIASGCLSEEAREQVRRTAVRNGRIDMFLVPNDKSWQRQKWMTKPFGVSSFLSSVNVQENLLILLEPDMVILKPFNVENVTEGHPVAQKYGIGSTWLNWDICPNMCNITTQDAWNWYSVGPPIMMHINDWQKVAPSWLNYAFHVWKHDSSIFSDIYSYVIAAAANNIKHNIVSSLMVSDANVRYYKTNFVNEAWPTINIAMWKKLDVIDKVNIIHYCQTYYLGDDYTKSSLAKGTFNFHKGHLPYDILVNCDMNLLVEVETSLENLNKDRTKGGRHLWLLHHVITRVNAALENYKLNFCPGWEKSNDIVLIQPETDAKNRMWYLKDHYEDSGGRNDIQQTNGL